MTRGQLVLLGILWGFSWVPPFPPKKNPFLSYFQHCKKNHPAVAHSASTWLSMECDTWKNSVGVSPPWVRAQPGKALVVLHL